MAHIRQSRPWLSGKSPYNLSSCSLFDEKRLGCGNEGFGSRGAAEPGSHASALFRGFRVIDLIWGSGVTDTVWGIRVIDTSRGLKLLTRRGVWEVGFVVSGSGVDLRPTTLHKYAAVPRRARI